VTMHTMSSIMMAVRNVNRWSPRAADSGNGQGRTDMGAFETGKYRNLFLESGKSEQEIAKRLEEI